MMPEIWYISKEKQEGLSTEEIIKVFNSANDLSEIKNLVSKSTERLFVGWASVEAKDKDGELIPIEDIIKEHSELMETLPAITDSHTNSIVGKTLAFKVMTHPITKTTGVLQLNQIFKRNSKEDMVWKETVDGTRKGLSVGGIADKSKTQYEQTGDGSFVKVLSGFKQFETANCVDPCNPYATIEATSMIAKSNSKMEEEKVIEETNKMDENDMNDNPQEAQINVNELAKVVQTLVDRLNEVESVISGKPEEEEKMDAPMEEETPITEPEEEKKMEDEDEKEEEKPETEDKKKESTDLKEEESSELSDLKKEVSELKKSNEELIKKFTVTEVIESSRPDINSEDVNKNVKTEENLAGLVAKGKMTSKEAIAMRLNQ